MYTIIVVSGPKDGTPYPSICYDGKEPIIYMYKHIAEQKLESLQEWFPEAEYKIAKIEYV
jgi:hypothetical protein